MVYRGSKGRLLRELLPMIQDLVDRKKPGAYVEPFIGGANVIAEVRWPNKIGSDLNPDLVDFLNFCKEEPGLPWMPDRVTREHWTEVRDNPERFGRKYWLSVGWLSSFSGCFFPKGYGGGDYGTGRDRYNMCLSNMRAQAPKLADVRISCRDFMSYDPDEWYETVFYCDPPYRGTSGYGKIRFPFDDFDRWCRKMARNNWVLVSEFEMPSDFRCVWEKERFIGVNSDGANRTRKTERLYYIGKDQWSYGLF